MSLFQYFHRVDQPASVENAPLYFQMPANALGVTENELANINEYVGNGSRKQEGRAKYSEMEKREMARYANQHGASRAVRRYKKKFPKITESTLRSWVKVCRTQLKNPAPIQISERRGRPLSLPFELDAKLKTFLLNLRKAGCVVNRHVVSGVLMGLVRSNLTQYVDFCVSKGWVQSLYRRMQFTRRMVTTSRPVITKSIWEEVRTKFLHDIVETAVKYNISDELIFNIDQTPSKYVPTSKVTLARRGSKQVSLAGSNDKRTITVTYAQTLAGDILPFQLIYKGKTKRSLPKTTFPKGFVLSANKSHWSNETETIRLLNRIIHPYAQRKKADLDLPSSQKSLIIWDAFRGHETDKVEGRLKVLDIETKGVPGNFTHLLLVIFSFCTLYTPNTTLFRKMNTA